MDKEETLKLIDGLTMETSFGKFMEVYGKIAFGTMSKEEQDAVALTSNAYSILLTCLGSPEKMVEKYKQLLKDYVSSRFEEGEE